MNIFNLFEKKKKKSLKNTNPCWKGYHPVGTKEKNGKTVPNCVPESVIEDINASQESKLAESDSFNRGGFNKLRDKNDYHDKREHLAKQLDTPGFSYEDRQLIRDRMMQLDKAARMQGLIENTDAFTSAGLNGVASVTAPENNISPVGSGTSAFEIDELDEAEDEVATNDITQTQLDPNKLSPASRDLIRVARQHNPEAMSDIDAVFGYLDDLSKDTRSNGEEVSNILKQLAPISNELDKTEKELSDVESTNRDQQKLLNRLRSRLDQIKTGKEPSKEREKEKSKQQDININTVAGAEKSLAQTEPKEPSTKTKSPDTKRSSVEPELKPDVNKLDVGGDWEAQFRAKKRDQEPAKTTSPVTEPAPAPTEPAQTTKPDAEKDFYGRMGVKSFKPHAATNIQAAPTSTFDPAELGLFSSKINTGTAITEAPADPFANMVQQLAPDVDPSQPEPPTQASLEDLRRSNEREYVDAWKNTRPANLFYHSQQEPVVVPWEDIDAIAKVMKVMNPAVRPRVWFDLFTNKQYLDDFLYQYAKEQGLGLGGENIPGPTESIDRITELKRQLAELKLQHKDRILEASLAQQLAAKGQIDPLLKARDTAIVQRQQAQKVNPTGELPQEPVAEPAPQEYQPTLAELLAKKAELEKQLAFYTNQKKATRAKNKATKADQQHQTTPDEERRAAEFFKQRSQAVNRNLKLRSESLEENKLSQLMWDYRNLSDDNFAEIYHQSKNQIARQWKLDQYADQPVNKTEIVNKTLRDLKKGYDLPAEYFRPIKPVSADFSKGPMSVNKVKSKVGYKEDVDDDINQDQQYKEEPYLAGLYAKNRNPYEKGTDEYRKYEELYQSGLQDRKYHWESVEHEENILESMKRDGYDIL